MSITRIELDHPRCEGHGLCEEAAPQLMHLDDDGGLHPRRHRGRGRGFGRPPRTLSGSARRCPEADLSMTNTRNGESAEKIVIVGNIVAGLTG